MNISNNISSMMSHTTKMNTNADNIANVNTDGFIPRDTRIISNGTSVATSTVQADNNGSQRSQTDLNKEIPDQIITNNGYSVNATAIKTQDEMLGTLLDMEA